MSETVPTVGQQSRQCQESRTAQGQQDGPRVLSHPFWSSQEGVPAWEQNRLTEPKEDKDKKQYPDIGRGGGTKDTSSSREKTHFLKGTGLSNSARKA